MKNRLSEIVQKNTSHDILAQVEHFQNQFIIQDEQLDILNPNKSLEIQMLDYKEIINMA